MTNETKNIEVQNWIPLSKWLELKKHRLIRENCVLERENEKGNKLYTYKNNEDGRFYKMNAFNAKNGKRYCSITLDGYYEKDSVKNLEELNIDL